MTVQWIAVAIIVPLCTLYALWNLMGAAARRHVVARLARLPWPAAWANRLAKAGSVGNACGCDGCDKPAGTDTVPPAQSIVQVHRRRQ